MSVPLGWRARYTREGVTFTADFSDTTYGSPELALNAAKEWHEEAKGLLPPMGRRAYAEQKKVTNTSGIVGVRRIKGERKGHTYWSWMASWTPAKGKTIQKKFGVLKHGEEGAKKLAIEARAEGMKNIEDQWPEDYWDYRRNPDGTTFKEHNDEEHPWKDLHGHEGTKQHKEHIVRERDRTLRHAKLEQFLEDHGRLFCEVCDFCFETEYGLLGRGIIEVHHTLPVADMEEGHKTRLKDLICICANCHLVVHNGDHYLNMQKLKFIYSAKKTKKKPDTSETAAPTKPSD